MKKRTFQLSLLALSIILIVLPSTALKVMAQKGSVVRVSETQLRKWAKKKVMPLFPDEAKKDMAKGSRSVAVVELIYDTKGDIVYVDVLEAPHNAIKLAISTAIKDWKFMTIYDENKIPVSIKGKLTFYYVVTEKGEAVVENPVQFR